MSRVGTLYSYCSSKGFDEPPNYMYSGFHGEAFIDDYILVRKARINTLSKGYSSSDVDASLGNLMWYARKLSLSASLTMPSLNDQLSLTHILETLLGNLVIKRLDIVTPWLNRVIQRYEVTKRLYEHYMPGLRRGFGDYSNISLYINFGLCLTATYALSKNLQYLGTLLKLNDMLLSIVDDRLLACTDSSLVCLLLKAELGYVGELGGELDRHEID